MGRVESMNVQSHGGLLPVVRALLSTPCWEPFMEATNGKGVDVALNSLAGEQLGPPGNVWPRLAASLKLVSETLLVT